MGLAVTEAVTASSRASFLEKLAMRNVARKPWEPTLPGPVIGPSRTTNSRGSFWRKALTTVVNPESSGSMTSSNSSDASLRVLTVGRYSSDVGRGCSRSGKDHPQALSDDGLASASGDFSGEFGVVLAINELGLEIDRCGCCSKRESRKYFSRFARR